LSQEDEFAPIETPPRNKKPRNFKHKKTTVTSIQIRIPLGFQTIETDKLKPHPRNVKIHTPEQIEAIAEAIKLLRIFKDPIVIDKKNLIWIGNGRWEAAVLLGMPRVPIIYLDHLTMQQRKALMILDNKLTEMSKYNKENMTALLAEIPSFDFQPFHMEFDEYIHTDTIQDEIPDPRPETDIKLGDMFQLGKHRLLCGDCKEDSNMIKLLDGAKVEHLNTDPPYGVDYAGKNEFLNKWDHGNRIQVPIENDDIKDYQAFSVSWLEQIPFATYNTIYVFQAGLNYHKFRLAAEQNGITWGADLIWKKSHFVFGRKDYKFQHEPIFYGWYKKHKFYGPTNRSTLLEYDRPAISELHPTTKPIEILVQIIEDGSKRGAVVYDPFAGSGSTLIACEQSGRICYTMEKDPIYCQTVIDRWEKFTGLQAKKI